MKTHLRSSDGECWCRLVRCSRRSSDRWTANDTSDHSSDHKQQDDARDADQSNDFSACVNSCGLRSHYACTSQIALLGTCLNLRLHIQRAINKTVLQGSVLGWLVVFPWSTKISHRRHRRLWRLSSASCQVGAITGAVVYLSRAWCRPL